MYRNAGDAEPREWVYAAARAEGAVIVLGALVGLYGVATSEDDEALAADEEATAESSDDDGATDALGE